MPKDSACQICGSKLGLKADGTIRLHHRRGAVCPGSHARPFAESCDVIESEIARLRAADARWSAWFARDTKGNMPPADVEFAAMKDCLSALLRLERRRKSWDKRDWTQYWCGETERFRKRPPELVEIAR